MDYAKARENMIVGQLTPNRITDKGVLERFSKVSREFFVSQESREISYQDNTVSIGYGREMFAPLTCATLVQDLELQNSDRLLIVATGTGYTAAVAAPLVKQVVAVEDNINLRDIARRALKDHHVSNVELLEGQPQDGCPMYGQFDKILIDAPVEEIPQSLVGQLNDGGKLGAVVRNSAGLLSVSIYSKQGNTLFEDHLFEVSGTVPESFKAEERFVF